MTTAWTLWVLFSTGILTPDIRYMQAPMFTKEACVAAGKQLLKNSKGIAILCLGSETGEVFKVEQ